MSDVAPADIPTQSAVVCEVCGGSTDVRWYCKNCQGSLCDTCREVHRDTAISKKHAVVPRTGDVLRLHGPAKIAEPCQKHKSKEISAYCNRCQVECCVSCLIESHKSHDVSTIEDAYLSAEKRLNDYIRELDKDVKGKLDEMATQTLGTNADLVHHMQKAKDDVNAFRKEMKQEVDKSCDALIDELESPTTELTNILKNLAIHKDKVDELIKQCIERIRQGKLDIIKYTPPTPTSLIPKANLPSITIPLFVPNKKILNVLKKEVGTIEYKQRIRRKADNEFDIKMISVKGVSSFSAMIRPTSISTAGNNTAWVASCFGNTMYLLDKDGNVVRSLTVMKGKNINDMVVKPSGEVIVSNGDMKVRCVSVGGKVSILIDTASFCAGGVCMTDRGEIVVCMIDQGERNHVAVYSSDGLTKLREIRCQDAQGRQLFTSSNRVVQNGEDLCVVNIESNVVCVDNQGNVKWVYEGKKGGLCSRFNPRSICRDKYHNLLVTDISNHCIHYIDREGQLIQIILTREQTGLYGHWGISVDDETGLVWGSGGGGLVFISAYLNND